MGGGLVDQPCDSAGIGLQCVNGSFGEDLPVSPCSTQVIFEVTFRLSTVKGCNPADQVDPQPDSRIVLQFQFLPELGLSGQDEDHRADRVQVEIK